MYAYKASFTWAHLSVHLCEVCVFIPSWNVQVFRPHAGSPIQVKIGRRSFLDTAAAHNLTSVWVQVPKRWQCAFKDTYSHPHSYQIGSSSCVHAVHVSQLTWMRQPACGCNTCVSRRIGKAQTSHGCTLKYLSASLFISQNKIYYNWK